MTSSDGIVVPPLAVARRPADPWKLAEGPWSLAHAMAAAAHEVSETDVARARLRLKALSRRFIEGIKDCGPAQHVPDHYAYPGFKSLTALLYSGKAFDQAPPRAFVAAMRLDRRRHACRWDILCEEGEYLVRYVAGA
jgi:hypothetical protein